MISDYIQNYGKSVFLTNAGEYNHSEVEIPNKN